MNWNAPGEAEAPMVAIGEPVVAGRAETSAASTEGDWLCALCHHRVANERDRFSYGGQDEFSFSNPDGLRFDIVTFSETCGCRQTGVPTTAYTWFPGHAWSFCHCGECGLHLGWFYIGEHEFVGLIKNRIVRALYCRN